MTIIRRMLLSAALLAVAAAALFVFRLRDDPFQASAVAAPPFTSLTYGIQVALWWDEDYANLSLDWVRLMVFSHAKQIFAWEDLEPERGVWDFSRADRLLAQAEEKGVRLVARLSDAPDWSHPGLPGRRNIDFVDAPPDDLADFGAYCGRVAERYRGRIAAYQIWNEPNLTREWGSRPPDAAGYVALLRECSRAIRAADPAAILISAGLAPTGTWDASATPDDMFFQAMYDVGFQEYVDVAGVNAPGYNLPPEVSPDEAVEQGYQRFGTFRRVEDLRQIMVRNGDAARQMAILEMGWTTDRINPAYAWFAVTPEQQADYFVRAYAYAAEHWRPWMGLMSAIYIPDPEWGPEDEQYWWSILQGERGYGEALAALANMSKFCGERVIPARAPDSPEALGLVTTVPCP